MAGSNDRPDRKKAGKAGRRHSTGTSTVKGQTGTTRPATGQSAARAPRMSKRSWEVTKQISIDRRDAMRELAKR